ncbi:DNA repair protein RecO [bacterium]|nr:MAG: DNA repair protein RecO [bacterium]
MAEIQRTEGIILKNIPFGEADAFFVVLTKDFGKMKIFAKGVRKIDAKLAGHLDLFNKSEIAFVMGKKFPRLTGSITDKYYKNIKSDLDRLAMGFFVAELSDQMSEENVIVREEYRELSNVLDKLESAPDHKIKYIPAVFAARLLNIAGYCPDFNDKNNETKLLRLCIKFGYDIIEKVDLSSVNLSNLRKIIEDPLSNAIHSKLNSWQFVKNVVDCISRTR